MGITAYYGFPSWKDKWCQQGRHQWWWEEQEILREAESLSDSQPLTCPNSSLRHPCVRSAFVMWSLRTRTVHFFSCTLTRTLRNWLLERHGRKAAGVSLNEHPHWNLYNEGEKMPRHVPSGDQSLVRAHTCRGQVQPQNTTLLVLGSSVLPQNTMTSRPHFVKGCILIECQ